MRGKYTHTPHVHTHAHTPQINKAPKNDLSRKSLFQAEGQGGFKDAPRFPLVLLASFSLGPCLGPHCQPGEQIAPSVQLVSGRGDSPYFRAGCDIHPPRSLQGLPDLPRAQGRDSKGTASEFTLGPRPVGEWLCARRFFWGFWWLEPLN